MRNTYTHAEWVKRYDLGRRCADNVSKSIKERGWQLAAEAGMGSHNMGMIHNALIAYKDGRPWQEITDHKKLKEANYLLTVKCFEPHRLLSEWDKRVR